MLWKRMMCVITGGHIWRDVYNRSGNRWTTRLSQCQRCKYEILTANYYGKAI